MQGLFLEQELDIPQQLLGMKVSELLKDDGRWNWELLQNWMPGIYQQKIASMYNNLCGYNINVEHAIWCKAWKLNNAQ
jgi:hypothetical protein